MGKTKINKYFYAFDYTCSGENRPHEQGDLAAGIAQCVLATVRNQILVKGDSGHRVSRPPHGSARKPNPVDKLAVISCTITGNADLPTAAIMTYSAEAAERQRARRPRPGKFGFVCAMGVQAVIENTQFFAKDAKKILSGPEELLARDLIDHIAALPVLNEPYPRTSEEFATQVMDTSNVIFGMVSGGTLPAISCGITYARTNELL